MCIQAAWNQAERPGKPPGWGLLVICTQFDGGGLFASDAAGEPPVGSNPDF